MVIQLFTIGKKWKNGNDFVIQYLKYLNSCTFSTPFFTLSDTLGKFSSRDSSILCRISVLVSRCLKCTPWYSQNPVKLRDMEGTWASWSVWWKTGLTTNVSSQDLEHSIIPILDLGARHLLWCSPELLSYRVSTSLRGWCNGDHSLSQANNLQVRPNAHKPFYIMLRCFACSHQKYFPCLFVNRCFPIFL